ncbi:MAG: transglutaminase domain-containing protein [Bacteroidaceae bacterium]|nr:transglutaminase domain-containing protein [Bacteroidaceae bacterium]
MRNLKHTVWGALGLLMLFMTGCTKSTEQEMQEAMDFLYASMPLPDSVDYSREFWEANVRATLKARQEMPWGDKVPEREWRHFVLPLRVNNENLDSARIVLYEELKDRVKNLNMYDAVLEVNHWCHEHVTYAPSDSRTKSPLVTMRSATGRCGEESTFTVAALRAVGIPARQVYTPRWAHTDDNHAWVEAWVNGKWYFMGACEPQPVLNMGWFNEPASRGMLMHTKVFGNYDGPEEVVSRNACYTEINVTSNYAETDTITVKVVNAQGSPLKDATVDFRLYNYAEFYTLVSKSSDAEGLTWLGCGKGDLLVWVSKDGHFGFEKASVGKQDTVTVVVDKDDSYTASLDLDLVPPPSKEYVPDLSDTQIRKNRERLHREDSLRNNYMKQAFSREEDLRGARQNWRVIKEFQSHKYGWEVISTLRQKDLCDVTAEVLADAADNTPFSDSRLWLQYILAPRISNEMLTPYRKVLSKVFAGMDAAAIAQWVRDSISIDNTRNPQKLCMSPEGVYRHRTTDAHSRDIFFVAACRSVGIAARIDEVTGKVQTPLPPLGGDTDGWADISFSKALPQRGSGEGALHLIFSDFAIKENPSYYSQFTLSRLQNGTLSLQEFPEEATWKDTFSEGVRMDAGQYLLVSGTRMADGSVLAHLEFFGLKADGVQKQTLKLRDNADELRVIGTFNCENYFTNYKGIHKPLLESTGRGYYLVALIRDNHEPSTHILHECEEANIYLSQWPHLFVMLFPTWDEFQSFRSHRKDFDRLPDNFIFGVADPETIEAMHIQELTHGSQELPILLMGDTFNRVVWFQQGYTIGIVDQIMSVIRQLMIHEK